MGALSAKTLLLIGSAATLLACSTARQYTSFGVGPPGGSSDAVGVIAAVVSSGVSRASGGCYAACPTGTHCIEATGYCEPLPCRGQCGDGEKCGSDGVTCQLEHEPPMRIQE